MFFNEADEPGWYNIKIGIFLVSGGTDYDQINLDFDPPGGVGDGDPDITLVLD